MAIVRALFCLLFIALFCPCFSQTEVPRVVICPYDHKKTPDTFFTNCHNFAEMPLNHLGLKVEYVDFNQPLPNIADRQDVIGVLSWLHDEAKVPNPQEYVQWIIEAVDRGKKFVLIGNPGFDVYKGNISQTRANQLWRKIGLEDEGDAFWEFTRLDFHSVDEEIMHFERTLHRAQFPLKNLKKVSDDLVPHLTWKKEGGGHEVIMVSTHPQGGYADEKHFILYNTEDSINLSYRYWYINPFTFFKKAFGTDRVPKLDTTTLAGNRIYYSHLDGDGWNNLTEVEPYSKLITLSSEVIYSEIFLKYPHLPATVGPIGADIDLTWEGSLRSHAIAKEMFALPYIKPAVHTYSHPFDWKFFAKFATKPQTERQLSCEQSISKQQNLVEKFFDAIDGEDEDCHLEDFNPDYDQPRAFDQRPFDLHMEVNGAVDLVNEICPKEKPVTLYIWSGDCRPFPEAIAKTREAGVWNMNGGDTRLDELYNSVAWVTPLTRQAGGQLQVYSSNSNENTYTDLWKRKFYGFIGLIDTFKNTESPIRLKPMNVYYHIYSGQKRASLEALRNVLDYVSTKPCVPIHADEYARLIEGFVSGKIFQEGEMSYVIEERGNVQTVRFDVGTAYGVDYAQSKGIVGHCVYQESLYVYLDEGNERPLIAIKQGESSNFYLEHSRWRVRNLRRGKESISFDTFGFGKGEMEWVVPKEGEYEIIAGDVNAKIASKNNRLKFMSGQDAYKPIRVEVRLLKESV